MPSPKPEDFDEVLRAYGGACYQAQNLEASLRMLLVLATAYEQKAFSYSTVRYIEDQTARDTLRKLFQKVGEKEYFTPREQERLYGAIGLRNFIVHGYWDKHTLTMATKEGRAWLVTDLQKAGNVLHEANTIVTSLKILGKILGTDHD
jgi:hypothetical protein